MRQDLCNHIALVLDGSGSMSRLVSKCTEVFDKEIENLKQKSRETDQEFRVSVYVFGSTMENIVFDVDINRCPSLRGKYAANMGMTALIDAVNKVKEDLETISQRHGDHSFLIYCLTDGQENASRNRVLNLPKEENWTLACMVPDYRCLSEAMAFGFPSGNISIWDATSEKGVTEQATVFRSAMDNYVVGRSRGVRGSSTYFTDLAGVTTRQVKQAIPKLDIKNYTVYSVKRPQEIRDFIESKKMTYKPGMAFYELTKREELQEYKSICVRNERTKEVFTGPKARSLLGLADGRIKVSPGDHSDWKIFVQSMSFNRVLQPSTECLVMLT